MRILLLTIALLISSNVEAQFFKEIYKDFLKYGTFYAAGNIENAQAVQPNYFIRTDPEDFYGIPQVEDRAQYHPFNYRYGFGIVWVVSWKIDRKVVGWLVGWQGGR